MRKKLEVMKYKNENKTLVVLDLDETLIYATKTPLEKNADFLTGKYHVYKRPFFDEFIHELKTNFLVAVWSSASDDYVAEIVKVLFPKNYPLEFVWARSRCTLKHIFDENFTYRHTMSDSPYIFAKHLRKLKKQGFDLNRILIVDDTPEKCSANYGNAIYPKEFLGDECDNELKLLVNYLKTLKDKSNVCKIEKRNWRGS